MKNLIPIASVVLTATMCSSPYATAPQYLPKNNYSYFETVDSSSSKGDFLAFNNLNKNRNEISLVNAAIEMVGDPLDLTEEEVKNYHENVINRAKYIGGSYFD